MNQYKNMSNKEIMEQIEWSDNHEFTYDYSLWAFNEIDRLNKIIDELEKDLNYQINDLEKDGYDLPSVREQSLWLSGCYDEDKLILNKLQELKEEGK